MSSHNEDPLQLHPVSILQKFSKKRERAGPISEPALWPKCRLKLTVTAEFPRHSPLVQGLAQTKRLPHQATRLPRDLSQY
jgi:hypothetical protein